MVQAVGVEPTLNGLEHRRTVRYTTPALAANLTVQMHCNLVRRCGLLLFQFEAHET